MPEEVKKMEGGNVRCPPRRIKVQLILPQCDACPIEGDVSTAQES
jgi:hypothetical protein